MLEVFFKGIGDWYDINNTRGSITGTIEANGVFKLTDDDEIAYKYSKSLDGVKFLLPSTLHTDSEFLKLQRLGLIDAEYLEKSAFRIYYSEYQWKSIPRVFNVLDQQSETVGDGDAGGSQGDTEPASVTKPRRKRKPVERESNEGLLLVDELLTFYEIEYLDELKGIKAWGRIISGGFSSGSIKGVSDAKKFITLASGEKFYKSDFLEKYRKRFSPK
jgi:hypothetical protein